MNSKLLSRLSALGLAMLASAASFAYDYNGNQVGHLYVSHTTAQIKQKITQGWRPTSIDMESMAGTLGIYRVALVHNSGTHNQVVRFEGEQTAAQIDAIRNSGWRIEDIEVVGSRYSAIFIRNNVNPKTTTWFAGWTAGQISTWLNNNKSFRILDLDRYLVSGAMRFSGVFIQNTGAGAVSGWGWMPDHTIEAVNNWAKTNGMRVIDLERGSNGRFAAVFAKAGAGQRYYWFHASTLGRMFELMNGLGLRIVTLNSYATGSGRHYSATMVNNTNAQSARIADLCFPRHNGVQGFYVHQIGSTSPVVGLNHNAPMHPSSSIKALIHYTGAWQTPAANLNTRLIGSNTMVALHRNMMFNSNNPASNLLMDTYGTVLLHAVAHNVLGMSQTTRFRNRFGTGGPYGNDQITETTLADFGILYRAIQNGNLGITKTNWLRANMNNETRSFPWTPTVNSVRTQIGITTSKFNEWQGHLRSINKAGNNGDSDGINGYWSMAGVVTLPFKVSGNLVLRNYLFGHYVNRSTISYEGSNASNTIAELLREQIRASMLSFK